MDLAIEAVRSKWDPLMCSQIAAHVTLVHRLHDHQGWKPCLGEIAAATPALRLHLGRVQHWGEPHDGIFVVVSDIDGSLERIRRSIGAEDQQYRPHVTIVHPRTTTQLNARQAWDELHDWDLDTIVTIDVLDAIESTADGWTSTTRAKLGRINPLE